MRERTTCTCYFMSRSAADRYYQDYGYPDASAALESKSIHIGKPDIGPNERLTLNSEGRYIIHSPSWIEHKPSTLEEELSWLTLEDGVILLPTAKMSHYAEIKRRIEKAGGRYARSGFIFEYGVDVEEIYLQLQAGKIVDVQQQQQAFYTPEDEAHALCRKLGDLTGKRLLEPSAGRGVLAKVAEAAGAKVLAVENYHPSVLALRAAGFEVIEQDFLTVTPEQTGLFEAVIANPPFTRGADISHVMHMWEFLKPGGQLAAIMSTTWQTGSLSAQRAFRAFLEEHDAEVEEIPAGAFKASGTGIATVRVLIRKPLAKVAAKVVEQVAVFRTALQPEQQLGLF